jgi:HAE1 family hydrophobic/amphiphilic exporter-1
MALLFESVLFPLIVLLSLPLALVGAFGLLALTGNTLNMMSMIGMILLTGLVGKNAILLVDYTNHLRRAGLPRAEALLQAGPTRLRPILMTSSALILAMLPLAAKLGDGGEWRAPLAVTVIGGLLTSTFLTLLVVPSVYTLVDDAQRLMASLPSGVRRLFRSATSSKPARAAVPVLAGASDED